MTNIYGKVSTKEQLWVIQYSALGISCLGHSLLKSKDHNISPTDVKHCPWGLPLGTVYCEKLFKGLYIGGGGDAREVLGGINYLHVYGVGDYTVWLKNRHRKLQQVSNHRSEN